MNCTKFNNSLFFVMFLLVISLVNFAYADPSTKDPNLKVEKIVTGLDFPVQMEFVGNDILVIQKNDGDVRIVKDGILQEKPVFHLDVENRGLEGLLGIEVIGSEVYLYATQLTNDEKEPEVNRIYRYTWDGEQLTDGKLINELPGNPKFHDHVGGVLISDSNKNVYAVIGDLYRRGFLQNSGTGEPDDSGIILKVGIDQAVVRPYLSDNSFKHYYAVGIRNSYGLTFDPVTGNMWETENGPENYDEVNLVLPNFNSGWSKIMGKASHSQLEEFPGINGFTYSDPEFTWETPIGPTQLVFPSSENFRNYNDTLFVGNVMTGMIHQFKLTPARTGFVFENPDLKDLVHNDGDSVNEIIFATGFNGIVDLDMGPDGNLYVLTIYDGGSIYKISPTKSSSEITSPQNQMDSGISPQDVDCKKGLVLIINIRSDQIACVKPITTAKLMERNWGMLLDVPISNHCSSPATPSTDWSSCDFSLSNLSQLDLENGILKEANLASSILFKTNLSHANLQQVDLTSSDLSEADLSYANLHLSRLTQGKLNHANLTEADLSQAAITNADLSEANLSNANLSGSFLNFSNLSNADLSGTDLSNVSFIGANLTGAVLRNANLTGANFSEVDLSKTVLEGCSGNPMCN